MMMQAANSAWHDFIEQQLPTSKNEAWKYVDFSHLKKSSFQLSVKQDKKIEMAAIAALRMEDTVNLIFVDGFFNEALSDQLPTGCVFSRGKNHATFSQYLNATLDAKKFPFANLNRAIFSDDFVLTVADNATIARPLHFVFVGSQKDIISHPRRLITMGRNSHLTISEEYVSLTDAAYMTNIVTHIDVNQDATLRYAKVQNENAKAFHVAATFVQQHKNSETHFNQFSRGGLLQRDDLYVSLLETGASCHTAGFYQLHTDNQCVDHHVDIMHLAGSTESEMLYKGILDKKSKSIFNGKLYVEKNAQKITAYQANHNLLMSSNAEVYSKPELEIYADDVKCKHGATTGQIDLDALFYLRSRGISETEALEMLLAGFAREIFDRIENQPIRKRIESRFKKMECESHD